MAEKKTGDFYTGVRQRGMLNTMLQGPQLRYETLHPDQRCRWEFSPTTGDNSMVVYREAQGYHIVKNSELELQETSADKSDTPVRRGDLVLMAALAEVHQALLDADAEMADQDYRAPERAYKDAMEDKQYKLNDGDIRPGRAFGDIKRTADMVDTEQFQEGRVEQK